MSWGGKVEGYSNMGGKDERYVGIEAGAGGSTGGIVSTSMFDCNVIKKVVSQEAECSVPLRGGALVKMWRGRELLNQQLSLYFHFAYIMSTFYLYSQAKQVNQESIFQHIQIFHFLIRP